MFIIEPLKAQDRKDFDCGEDALNRYLRERATQDIKRRLNRVFVAIEEGKSQVIGYYTLAATTVEAEKLPPSHTKHLPKYPIPAALLGKLAVDKGWAKQGLGKLLLANAIRRVQVLEKEIGIHVLVVDPLTDDLIRFYTPFGFLHIPPERRLFLFTDGIAD